MPRAPHWLDGADEHLRLPLQSGLLALANLRDDLLLRRVWAAISNPLLVAELEDGRQRIRRRWALALVAVLAVLGVGLGFFLIV